MITAGIREIKNRLSHYLRCVAEGETVQVTDRGRVVAHLGPPAEPGAQTGETDRGCLERLARAGRIRLGTGRLESAWEPLPRAPWPPSDLARILEDVRADRALEPGG